MTPGDNHAVDLKWLLTATGSMLAAFVCGVMTFAAGGDDHVTTIWWAAEWLLTIAIVLACSYVLLRRLGVSSWVAAACAPLLAVAQFAVIALIILGIFAAAMQ